ncbi:MAG: sensor histidine kinase [Streptosporangiaceae bacterium]
MKRLSAWAAKLTPRQQDLSLAVVLAVVNVGTVLPYWSHLHPQAWAVVLLILQALPLAYRRDYPVLVFLAVGLPRSIYDRVGFGYAPVPVGPAIAYFTIMERSSTRVRWAMSALLLVGIVEGQTVPGHTEPYDFFVQLFIFGMAGFAGLLSRRNRAHLSETEARAERAESERDQQAALAAAGERARIARELHDVVAHHVSLMAVQAEAAGSLLPSQPEQAGHSVEIIGQTARQALTELRRLLGVLRGPGEQPTTPPSPSLGQLDGVLARVREAGLAVDLAVEGDPSDLAAGVNLTAYRIVQEGLTNALRHSAAPCAAVRICYEPGYVTVSITNSGPAPRNGRARPGQAGHGTALGGTALADGGFGLAGIAERVASCGGTLSVGPTGAGGFAVSARLPAL